MTQQSPSNPEELKILLELYKVAVDEYRFQTNLNWDRSKFYVLLNSALITATCGLLRLPSFKFAEFLTAPLFILGFLAAFLGYKTLMKGIEYIRRVVFNKAKFEHKLTQYSDIIPLDTVIIPTDIISADTISDIRDILNKTDEINQDEVEKCIKQSPSRGTICSFMASLFIMLMIINGAALLYLGYETLGSKFL